MGIDALIRKWEQEYKVLEEKQRKRRNDDLLDFRLSIYRVHLRELKEAWDIEVNDTEDTKFTKWAEEVAEESLRVLRDRDME